MQTQILQTEKEAISMERHALMQTIDWSSQVLTNRQADAMKCLSPKITSMQVQKEGGKSENV